MERGGGSGLADQISSYTCLACSTLSHRLTSRHSQGDDAFLHFPFGKNEKETRSMDSVKFEVDASLVIGRGTITSNPLDVL